MSLFPLLSFINKHVANLLVAPHYFQWQKWCEAHNKEKFTCGKRQLLLEKQVVCFGRAKGGYESPLMSKKKVDENFLKVQKVNKIQGSEPQAGGKVENKGCKKNCSLVVFLAIFYITIAPGPSANLLLFCSHSSFSKQPPQHLLVPHYKFISVPLWPSLNYLEAIPPSITHHFYH